MSSTGQDNCRTIGESIDDCALEIEMLVNIAEDQGNELFHENKRLKAEIYELKHNIKTEVRKQMQAFK